MIFSLYQNVLYLFVLLGLMYYLMNYCHYFDFDHQSYHLYYCLDFHEQGESVRYDKGASADKDQVILVGTF